MNQPASESKNAFHLVQSLLYYPGGYYDIEPQMLGKKFFILNMWYVEHDFAAPRSAALDRLSEELGSFELRAQHYTVEGVSRYVYFVGTAATLDRRLEDFQYWMSTGCPSHGPNGFRDCFTGSDPWRSDRMVDADAWWSLREELLWSMSESVAKELLTTLNAIRSRT